ncbi:MAG: hypothetical protein OER86_03675 [Phycisphaerae bacterium]|nr:hypothetical protein [Phycisphaerae bacterium]
MPPHSPKLSEAGQHVVLALVMAGVLAGSTTLAVLQSRSRHERIRPALSEILIDTFRVGRPAAWRALEASPAANTPQERRFAEPGTGGRVLDLIEWTQDDVTSPQSALGRFAERGPESGFRLNRLQAVRFGGLSGMVAQAVAMTPVGPSGTGVLGVLTLDGQTYLGVRLTTGLPQPRGSAELVGRILESARNEHYQPAGTPVRLGPSVELNVPAALRAFRAGGATDRDTVLLAPLGRARFGLLQLSVRSLDATPVGDEAAGLPPSLQALFSTGSPADPDQRLAGWLLWRHWRATGALPTPDSRRRWTIAERNVLATSLLDQGNEAGLRAAIWATRVGKQNGIFIDLIGTPAAWGNGRDPRHPTRTPGILPAGARELLENLVVSSNDRSETDDNQAASREPGTDTPVPAPKKPGDLAPSPEP